MVKLTLLDPQTHTSLQTWDLNNQSTIRIGRAPDNDVIVNDSLVSRHHVELNRVIHSQSASTWHLVNRGTNGTFVNGMLLSQGLIADNSMLQLAKGGPLLKFEIQPQVVNQQSLPVPNSQGCNHTGTPPNNLFCIRCGQPIVEAQRFIRQYQVLRTLGQGGMGTTYLAWDKQGTINGRPTLFVLKEMNADMAQIAKAIELFEREARILAGLNHSGIPKYYDFFVESGKKYLAMELIHGEDLEKRIYQRGPVIMQQALIWMIQTCEVLDYIHRQDPPLIHRDIKPANLLVRNVDNRVVVLDFGAVKEIGTTPGTRIGAEGYSAPEQDRGKPCTQSDLYAIGPTLIFLLSGENPIRFYTKRGSMYRFNIENIPTITPQLRAVIDRVTEPFPGDRFQSAHQLSTALSDCL